MPSIGTHDGSFHCDEALACHLLHLTKKFKDAKIVRSRKPEVLDSLDIIVDVGATYEPAKGRFDHHQKGFTEVFGHGFTTKLSSAGLIYKHYGEEVIRALHPSLSESDLRTIYIKVYKSFVEALDAIDNGISQYPEDVQPRYEQHTNLPSRVGRLNPEWNETGVDVQARFLQAVALAGGEFEQTVKHYVNSWLPARAIVQKALEERKKHHKSGEIVVLSDYTAWNGHLLDLESEMKLDGEVKYVIYKDTSGSWRVQAVPVAAGSFQSRLALPEEWRGLRDEVVSAKAGIEKCIFVHAGGFIGGNQTFEGALRMAVKSLELAAASKASPAAKRQKV